MLQVSVATVRRMEGRQLQPAIGDGGVRLFDPDQVQAVAAAIVRSVGSGSHDAGGRRLSAGELAAEVLERFEQRQSLSEIVRALRVEPAKVRALYHEWRTCLELGELQRQDAAPARNPRGRGLRVDNLDELLATLPEEPTRLSLARYATTDFGNQYEDALVYEELGGAIVEGPVTASELRRQYGPGSFRVTAYSLRERRVLWEACAEIR